MRRLLPSLILLGFAATVGAADVMYVDDALRVSMRAAPSNVSPTVIVLESGTRLEVLEDNGNIVRVRDPKGNEGWVRKQYLSEIPIARERLVVAEQKIAALEADRAKLREQVKKIDAERGDLNKSRTQLERDYQKLEKELAELRENAADPLRLSNDNKALRERLATLEKETEELRVENSRFRDDTNRHWFLTGAGVLGAGMLLGLILPKFHRRKSAWASDF